ncbi:MAG: hypothetical protein R3A46_03500 [Thermomicrobiales bacterium]
MAEFEISRDMLPDQPVGLFYAWWRGDYLPDLQTQPDLAIEFDPEPETIRRVADLDDREIERRAGRGNRAVVGRMDGIPAAIGWSSGGRVEIGELGLDFTLPTGNRYVWDFVTLPDWRGRGIYPALLQAFIRVESSVDRFWVGHDLDNAASSRGILKAGFQTVGEVYAVEGVGPVFVARGGAPDRAYDAADLLGIPLLDSDAGDKIATSRGNPGAGEENHS